MPMLTKCLGLPRGARFYRADLHIHSLGGSHDVVDGGMTPENIVAVARKEKLDAISVTDHNEIQNVEATIRAANGTHLFVIPGVELSTPQGHLLCYLPSVSDLQRFYGRLNIVDRGNQNSRCQNAMLDCLSLLCECGGFGALGHVDAGSGFETEVPGASPHKIDVLCHRGLCGIELKSAASRICYGDGDPDPALAAIGRERISRLGLGSKQFLARILCSDAHTLDALGKNAEGNRKVTRVKMDSPSFAALRIAFEDSDARIRIEDMIPSTVPTILGVHLEGGFLNDQTIHFSPNLNCIIGGRGAGKSTTFEALRLLSGIPSGNSVVDSEVWPNKLHLFWQDQAGQQHKLVRSIGGDVENIDDPENGPVVFSLDCFGQGETAKISEKAKTDPLALLKYLDRFVDTEAAESVEYEARQKLLDIQTLIEEATLKVESIPQYERALTTTQKQLEAIEKVKAKELIELQRKLATEQEARRQIVRKFEGLKAKLSQNEAKTEIESITQIADPMSFAVGVAEYQEIVNGANEFKKCVEASEGQINQRFKEFTAVTTEALKTWKAKESEAQGQIDLKRQEMEAQGIRLDMAYVQKLAKDEATQKQAVANLKTWIPKLKELKRNRVATLKERWGARDRVSAIREAYGRAASQTLMEALSDLQVSLKYSRNGYSPDAADLIIQAMGWRTVQQQRAATLVEQLTIPKLLDTIERKDITAITNPGL